MLEGLSVALFNIDEIIELIKAAPNPSEAKDGLVSRTWQGSVIKELIGDRDMEQFKNQLKVGANIASQIEDGSDSVFGVMIESHLNEGNQKVGPLSSLEYGVSITDSCIGWNDTEQLLRDLAQSVKNRNS